jgi:putative chitinase
MAAASSLACLCPENTLPDTYAPYLGNSEKMANHVYQGLNGNRPEAPGDGYAYRGGGFLQITGRKGYREVGLEDHPEEIERPDVAARASVDHWLARGLNGPTFEPIASQAAFNAVTRTINKGLLQGRQRWEAYGRGLRALSKPASGQP